MMRLLNAAFLTCSQGARLYCDIYVARLVSPRPKCRGTLINRAAASIILLVAASAFAQTGSISGRVQSALDGKPLPGANITLLGTQFGAITNAKGFYLISNAPAGTYNLRASFLGYVRTTAEHVTVRLNLTTTINFDLKEEVLQGEEVTVVAQRQIITPEASATLANIDAENLRSLPLATLEDAMRTQAGVEPDLTMRGGNINTVAVVVDGINFREGRTHAPVLGLSYTALEQMQVQTSGFDAEYGNVRSGLVQLVTKNPSTERYAADFFLRYRPAQPLRFANGTLAPRDEMSYDFDMTFGGPLIPAQRAALHTPRFLFSLRQKSEPYLAAYDRSARSDRTAQLKLVSEFKHGSKLTLMGLYSKAAGLADSISTIMPAGVPSYPWGFDNDYFKKEGLFKHNNIGLADIEHQLLAANFLHTFKAKTLFEIKLHRMASEYFLRPGAASTLIDRDTSRVVLWSSKLELTQQITSRIQLKAGLEYLRSSYNIATEVNDACATRVSALGSVWTLLCGDRVDYESPYRIYEAWRATPNQAAAYVQSKIVLHGMIINPGVRLDYFHAGGARLRFNEFDPLLGQSDPQTRRDSLHTTKAKRQFVFSPRLGVSFPVTPKSKLYFNYGHFRQMPQAQHLYMLQQKQFIAERSALTSIGNPDIPMPRTVAYELGFEQNLFDTFLFSAAGYARDIDKQTSLRAFIRDDVYYTIALPFNYNDVSGVELTLSKVKGNWLRGFANFTFMTLESGNFGSLAVIYDPLERMEYERLTQDHAQSKAAAQPYAHVNIELLAPTRFGPKVFGKHPFGDWRVAWLGEWRAGKVFTWGGPIVDEDQSTFGIQYTPPDVLQNNVRTRDYYRLDLRVSKQFKTRAGAVQLFLDVSNLLNLKFMYFERPFATTPENPFGDYNAYMASLHLPQAAFGNLDAREAPYLFIPGHDRPGDFRKAGAAFVPIRLVRNQRQLPGAGNSAALYYVHDSATYMQFENGAWQQANTARVQQVLADKAYIDMPNQAEQTFLNPRSMSLGVRFSF